MANKETEQKESEETAKTVEREKGDLGVPMLPGSPSERQGPEDALGEGLKRGDYTNRLGGSGYQPHQGSVPQAPRAADIGDVEGKKGGVETASEK